MNHIAQSTQTLSQEGQTHHTDVLVIGAGLAGLQFCLSCSELRPHTRITLISKSSWNECNSAYAQGGVATALSAEDSIEAHIQDTLAAGDGLCYHKAVEHIIQHGPLAIEILTRYGIQFDTVDTTSKHYAMGQEGGHSHRRILHVGDQTGLALVKGLKTALNAHHKIEWLNHHTAVNLITQNHPHPIGKKTEVLGAYILNSETQKIDTYLARCVILATGGAGKTYRYTSNAMTATGDGVALAYRAGARIGNMEFYQFHPTLLYHHTHSHFLISEAVRGEGGILRHGESLSPFMKDYAPDLKDLATRDIVARAIFTEIEQSEAPYVYLDITQRNQAFLKKRFPNIFHTLLKAGINMSEDLIPVVPAAHYQCGGVLATSSGETDLHRLYAIGEVAHTGLHGANRLASNSLLESLVMAKLASKHALSTIESPPDWPKNEPQWTSPRQVNNRRASQIHAHWLGLRGEMTSYAGIIRTEEGLIDLLSLIRKRRQIIEDYYWNHCITRDFIELRNIVLNAELIVTAALKRRESRGGHYREDYPHYIEKSQASISSIHAQVAPFVSE